jgi:quinol monooxygenase YgiN
VYTSGVWNVKAGKETEFAREWEASADRMSPDLPGVVFRLLRDTESPSRFVSLAGPWRNREQIDAMRASDQFQGMMSSMQPLLESYEPFVYEPMIEIS